MSIQEIQAIAFFDTTNIKGCVLFTEDIVNKTVIIDINLKGLSKMDYTGFMFTNQGICLKSVKVCVPTLIHIIKHTVVLV